jgi:hypothetical protein
MFLAAILALCVAKVQGEASGDIGALGDPEKAKYGALQARPRRIRRRPPSGSFLAGTKIGKDTRKSLKRYTYSDSLDYLTRGRQSRNQPMVTRRDQDDSRSD